MGFNVQNLQQYVALKSKEIAVRTISEPKTAKLLIESGNSQSDLKPGSHDILKLSQTVSFQDGASCGRVAGNDVVLSQKRMEVVAIKENLDICPKTLYNTYFSLMLNSGQDPETETDSAFANFIMENRGALIANEIEKMIWRGDKTLTGANNLKYIDGLLKLIAAGTHIALTDDSTDIIERMQNNWLAMPEEITNKEDFRIFLSETDYNKYIVAAANKNYFNPSEPFKLFGTNATLVPTPGLNGTDKMVYARLSEFAYGMDGVNDSDSATYRYSVETEKHYVDFRFALGVGVVYTEQVGITEAA